MPSASGPGKLDWLDRYLIHRLEKDEYRNTESSLALPMLTAGILTGFINQRRQKDQYDVLLALDEWLDDLNR